LRDMRRAKRENQKEQKGQVAQSLKAADFHE
jgi:hypothetical protein